MTIAREYTSDRMLGLINFFFLAVIGPKSSGADQRTEASPAFDLLTEYMSLAMEERPKFAMQGIPSALMNILYCESKYRTSIAFGGKYVAAPRGVRARRTPFKSPWTTLRPCR